VRKILRRKETQPSILEIKEWLVPFFEDTSGQLFPRELEIGTLKVQAADIASDVTDFRIQKEIFDARDIPHIAAANRPYQPRRKM
jgi:hypothetical protein